MKVGQRKMIVAFKWKISIQNKQGAKPFKALRLGANLQSHQILVLQGICFGRILVHYILLNIKGYPFRGQMLKQFVLKISLLCLPVAFCSCWSYYVTIGTQFKKSVFGLVGGKKSFSFLFAFLTQPSLVFQLVSSLCALLHLKFPCGVQKSWKLYFNIYWACVKIDGIFNIIKSTC